MLSTFDRRPSCSRREFLRIGTLGLGGLSLPGLVGTNAVAADNKPVTTGKSVIFLHLLGGPSQFETFDPKMSAPAEIRSVNGEIATALPGVTFGSAFPQLAKRAKQLAIVRSCNGGASEHAGAYPITMGTRETLGASLGSLYARMAGITNRANGMPSSAVLCPKSVDAACQSLESFSYLATGPLGSAFAPFVPGGSSTLQQDMQLRIARDCLEDRRQLKAQLDSIKRQIDTSGTMDAMDRIESQAFDVILRGVAGAFDLSQENSKTIARYDTAGLVRPEAIDKKYVAYRYQSYVSHAKTLGKLLLLARRLCEAGCGFVALTTNMVWDMHGGADNAGMEEGMRYVAPPLDHAVSAFLDDLEARGLSDQILLVMCGEMGRTPRLNKDGGRDHWGNLVPLVLAGGGLPMGQVIGRSTADGSAPADNPIPLRQLIGTIFHTLFDVPELRLRPEATGDVAKAITESEPIKQLIR
jgi:uncharacterized protein (DUF1501 family)